MSAGRLILSSLRSLSRFRLRGAVMATGTLVGVAALTFVLTVGAAGQRKLLDTVGQLFGPSSIVVSSGSGFFLGGPRGEAARLTLDDAAAIADALPRIVAWDPMQVAPDTPVRRGEASRTVRLLGVSERYERVWSRGVAAGEAIGAAEVAASARVALIGETVAHSLFGEQDPIDGEILVGSVPFRVTGVLEPLGTDIHGMDRDDEVVIPISTAMRRVMNVDVIRAVKLLVDEPAQVDATAAAASGLLRERHALAPGQPDDFTMMTSSTVRGSVDQIRRVLFLYLPLVAALALAAGSAVAASLMLASVGERVGEIGLRRAVGARPRDIRLQFLAETAITGLGGGVLGAALGTAAALVVADRFALAGGFSPGAIALGIGLALATSLLAGVLPAQRAARLDPAAALR